MSDWRCRCYRRLLVDYADGTIDPQRRQRVERHLGRCAECQAGLAALRDLPAVLQTSTVPDPGEEFWARQQQSIQRAIRKAPLPAERSPSWLYEILWPRRWRYALALAASIVVTWSVYRVTENSFRSPPRRFEDEIAALDVESLFALNEVLQVLAPADEYLPPVAADDERQLAAVPLEALPLDDFAALQDGSAVPRAEDLDDADLDNVAAIIGDAT